MFPYALLLLATIVVLLWWYSVDGAMRLLAERSGLPYNADRARWTRRLLWGVIALVLVIIALPKKEGSGTAGTAVSPPKVAARFTAEGLWMGPDTASIASLDPARASLVRYGRDLIANTAHYLGPQGIVDQRTNGMNCQNCHLDAGTRPWGNNYGAVWSQYPKFRERSGGMESVVKRVNDCVERSLNGRALDSLSHEMQAILAYMEWVGTEVPKGSKPKGTGLVELPYLDRAADVVHGSEVFTAKCVRCHGADGQGKLNPDGRTYQYPPLWGAHSFNIGAGLYRLSRLAGYVKANMPQTATWDKPQLTDEEAWDVAAYINSQQRPEKDLSADWPKIQSKPVDHPFGPYADPFPETQHKYGPFGPIAEARKR